jgi:hypothetical protein
MMRLGISGIPDKYYLAGLFIRIGSVSYAISPKHWCCDCHDSVCILNEIELSVVPMVYFLRFRSV